MRCTQYFFLCFTTPSQSPLQALTPGKANRELYNTLCAFYRNAYETLDPSLQGMLDKIETIAFSDGRAAGFGGLLDALLT